MYFTEIPVLHFGLVHLTSSIIKAGMRDAGRKAMHASRFGCHRQE